MSSSNSNSTSGNDNSNSNPASVDDADDMMLLDDSDSNTSQPTTFSQTGQGQPASDSTVKGIEGGDQQGSMSFTGSLEETNKQELKKLSLDEHGTFMADFHPEKSKRELRKLNRKLCTKDNRKNQMYDSQGLFMDYPMDLCDCLDKECPGCHFPCPKCGSSKCGTDCRCNRKYVIDLIEVEGTDMNYSFPRYGVDQGGLG